MSHVHTHTYILLSYCSRSLSCREHFVTVDVGCFAWFLHVMLLIVTYCLPCSLISFISIFSWCQRAFHSRTRCIAMARTHLVECRVRFGVVVPKKIQFNQLAASTLFSLNYVCLLLSLWHALKVLNLEKTRSALQNHGVEFLPKLFRFFRLNPGKLFSVA